MYENIVQKDMFKVFRDLQKFLTNAMITSKI